jgi:drug/metabolite transporter (DMT)-like permease
MTASASRLSVAGMMWAFAAATSFGVITTLARVSYDAGGTAAAIVALRYGAGTLAAIVLLLALRVPITVPTRAIGPVLGAGCGLLTMSACYLAAVAYIPVGLAALIFYTFPLMVAALAPLTEGLAVSRQRAVAFVIAFGGLGLALGPSFQALDWRGIVLAFGAASGSAAMLIFSTRALAHVTLVGLTFHANLFGLVAVGAVLMVADNPVLGEAAPDFLFPVAVAGVAALVFASVFYVTGVLTQFVALRAMGPSRTAMFLNLEPVVSILTAAVLLGERLTALQYAGGTMVIGALLMASRRMEAT